MSALTPNPATPPAKLTASKPAIYAGGIWRRERMLRCMHRELAAAPKGFASETDPCFVRQLRTLTKFNTDESLGRLIGTVFVIIGSLVAVAGLIWLIWTAGFVTRATKAPGQVIAMERSEGSEDGSMYQPVFTFTDSGGISHTQRSSSGRQSFHSRSASA